VNKYLFKAKLHVTKISTSKQEDTYLSIINPNINPIEYLLHIINNATVNSINIVTMTRM